MKNSLGMLGESLNSIFEQFENKILEPKVRDHYGAVQYESARVNNLLMQLLALYKLENEQLPFNPNYYNLGDFLEEQSCKFIPLMKAKGINYQIKVAEDLEAVFDDNLMATVLENIIGNAIRYTKSQIHISCSFDRLLTIQIADDGPGYPKQMIELAGDYIQGIDQSTGSTGLGLVFAKKIAELHSHKDVKGNITLSNGGELGGGIFEIKIP
ncbi:MAG: HAMP domain-containing sensor histidine kinase [Enterobacterales bacterium]|nr:HAMP domain-containing sensor histidine kinase [Enterobacterales bacterium]